MRFSEEEILQLIKAWAAISFAFAIGFSRSFTNINPVKAFVFSGLTVGISFLFHELAHKYLAQKYGCWAEFRSFDWGLILAVMSSFAGFIFAAPGAVFISGAVTREQNGKIAAAGSVVNLGLAGLFLIANMVIGPNVYLLYGQSINAWLALFNLLPLGMMDGLKVIHWDQKVWIGLFIAAIMMYWL